VTDDPLDQLERSHRRLEERLDDLAAAAQSGDVVALREVCAFFGRQVQRHEEDEERSLFPRLVANLPDEIRSLLSRLRAEHVEHENLKRRLEAATDALDRGHEAADTEIRAASDAIACAYRAHIAAEESQLFPFARAALTTSALEEMAREMDARRGRGGGGGRRRGA
jgi:hemerythrin-like domain-containing protein